MLCDNSMNVVMAMTGYYSDTESSKDHSIIIKTQKDIVLTPLDHVSHYIVNYTC